MPDRKADTIYELLKARAEHAPEAVAICAPGRSANTYGGLRSQVDRIGRCLNVRGVQHSDRVAIVLPNGPDMAVTFVGVAASAICAPLNPAYSRREFEFYLSDLKPKALIVQSGMNSAAVAVAEERAIAIIELSPKPGAADGVLDWGDKQQRVPSISSLLQANDIALILHTSGTTSRPKMVPLTHANLLASAGNIAATLRLSEADLCLNVMPLFHIHGLVGALLSSVMAGASVVCASGFDSEQFFSWLEAFRPTWYTAVPTIHHAVLDYAQAEPRALSNHSLRFIRSSSAALPARVMQGLEETFKVPVIESYGMTEAAHQMASSPLPPGQRKIGSVGLAAGPEVSIMDEAGSFLSSCEIGEIVIRGANVMSGYGNSEANAEAFIRGWFRTGDQGYLDKDGYLFISGRIKEIINRGGEKISPREVDDVILQHPAVAEAICFAMPHETLGEDIAAAVVLRGNAAVTERELQRFVAAQLAEFKIPRRVLFVEEIPKSATGKLQRIGLAEKFGALLSEQRIYEFLAPQTQVEKTLAAIWSEVLGVEQIGIQDNFFYLGGDSIRATQVISRIRRSMQTELSILSFFETPTVAGLAGCIETIPRTEPLRQAAPMQRVTGNEKRPLSFAQQRLWFLNQLEPANPVYNRPLALRLTGTLEAEVIERSINEIVQRHEILRTNFQDNGDGPVQIIAPRLTVDLPIIDLTYLPADEREAEALCQGIGESRHPFDLVSGALLRARLYRLGERDHLLLFVTHHIVFDWWSDSVLLGELAALYSSIGNGDRAELGILPIQYADYAAWQTQQNTEKTFATDLSYWKKQLSNPPPSLNLPTDRSRPALRSYRGARKVFSLSAQMTQRLKDLGRREHVTLFMTLLAALKTLLYRYTGQGDVLVGVPVAGRDQVETERLLGVFINTLVLRTDLSGEPSFRELLRRVCEGAIAAFTHQDLPFERLVEVLQPDRDLSRNPFFNVMFQLRNTPKQRIALEGLEVARVDLDIGVAKFDLTLEAIDEDEGLECRFAYNTDLFDPVTIDRMAGHFQRLLEEIVVHPDQRISELPLLSESEKHQLLVEWNDTKLDYPSDKCFPQLFEEQAKRTPDAVAVVFEDQQLIYRELNNRANQLAHYLHKRGVGPEVLVGICVERSIEMIIGLLGILKAGGAYVPLDPSYPKERLEFILSDSKLSVLLTQEHILVRISDHPVPVICIDKDREQIALESDSNPAAGVIGDNLAYVIYTSGTTGTPKGVMIDHRNLLNYLWWFNKSPLATTGQGVPVITRPTFDASVKQLFAPLLQGSQVWIVSNDVVNQPGALLAELSRRTMVGLNCVPSFWRTVLDNLNSDPAPAGANFLSSLLLGGEQLDQHLVDLTFAAMPHIKIWNLYGPTEATANACTGIIVPRCNLTIGKPIGNTQVYILDPQLKPVPIGVAGELHIGGHGLARGYLNCPELTAEKFIANPFSTDAPNRLYKTGDLARYLPDGNIEFLGRIDTQVKIRGFRIELGEIETVLGQHPAVREAVVLASGDSPEDKRLVAYVVAPPDTSTNALRSFLKQKLPEFMVPSAFVYLDSLPLTPTGKVDRKALPVPDQSRPNLGETYVGPRIPLEETVARIWAETLKLEKVGMHDNFFELGGHSLLILQLRRRLSEVLGQNLSVVNLFKHPTISSFVSFLSENKGVQLQLNDIEKRPRQRKKTIAGRGSLSTDHYMEDIAIIGMAARFPGAKNVAEFWHNLKNGVESISYFSAEHLCSLGVDAALLNNPNYVRAGGVLEGSDMFDAGFFGFSAREAEIMDPQQRLFLECAWEALEDAGYDSEKFIGAIGVYAGAGANYYLLNNLYGNRHFIETHEPFETSILNDKDFLATRVAYKLHLTGPALTIQTACSTSLVAVHVACQNLLDYQCDIALAGGVRINPQLANGYLYQEGMILAPDGHCRAFDEKAQGTVRGNGVGVVALKRLTDALADRDFIYALVKGSAVNNDGSSKVGYTAPSVVGQAAVVAMAQAMSGVDPETISYIEAHGTGTSLGDPIEIAGLTQAFRAKTQKKGFCAIGSLKTNVGHTDAAAGVAGLIKTSLALRHKLIPPSLNFEKPNPEIDFANSPFYVNSTLCEWGTNGAPRRAGVSSFGIGGTNAHAVIEEAPPLEASGPSRPWQVLVLSAKTKSALEVATSNLSEHLEQHPEFELADVAFTLQVGRKAFNHRRALVCQDLIEAAKALRSVNSKSGLTSDQEIKDRAVVFMFPGQGSQYVNMGRELYDTESTFREQLDNCADLLASKLGMDLRATLFPSKEYAEAASGILNRTLVAQPALFAVEYAMAKLLMSWGVKPRAMIGHSVGEYVAACLAGVFSLEDGLALIVARGRLMDRLPGGAMVAVPLPVDEVKPLLNDAIALAAHNGPRLCVLSGQEDELRQLEDRLRKMAIECRRLHTSHAFHSQMMEPVLQSFTEEVRKIKLSPPTIPYLSNVSGTWITPAAATDPNYWTKQLRQTVRFSDGLKKLLQQPDEIFIEVGPGQTLSSATKLHRNNTAEHLVVTSMKRSQDSQSDLPVLLDALGRLWSTGIKVDWSAFYSKEIRRRVPLPTYPFERLRYWVDPQAQLGAGKVQSLPPSKKPDIADWFYLPSWRRAAPKTLGESALKGSKSSWLVFLDEYGAGAQLAIRLEQSGQDVIAVMAGEQFSKIRHNVYAINPQRRDDYDMLLRELHQSNKQLRKVLHFWSVTRNTRTSSLLGCLEQSQDLGLFSLLFLAQSFGQRQITYPVDILVVSNHIQEVTGEETLGPEKATVLGACKTIPLEYSNMSCTNVDIVTPDSEPLLAPKLIDALLAEIMANATDAVVAYRGSHRWVQCLEPVRLDNPRDLTAHLTEGGVYLITGGLGGIGLTIAENLAITVRAKLILISRSAFPGREQWESWINTHDENDPISIKIRRLRSFEAAGAEVLILRADVASLDQMQNALIQATIQFGQVRGVIHAAGIADYAGIIDRRSREMTECVLAPKVIGALVLDELLSTTKLDFFVACSSLSSILFRGKFGQVGYCAANEFLDAFASYKLLRDKTSTVSINWCDWQDVGMAVDSRKRWAKMHGIMEDSDSYKEALSQREGLAPSEGAEVFQRILGTGYSRIAVSTRDLFLSIEQDKESSTPAFIRDFEKATSLERKHPRPELGTSYVGPRNQTEQTLAQVWQELLGFDQIGIHDNFFDLGGHSLLASQVISRIVKAFEIDAPLRAMFESPTVAEMAAVITEHRGKNVGEEELERMLGELEAVTDEEAQQLVAKETVKG